MLEEIHLIIRLTPGSLRPQWGRTFAGEIRGGPETLLGWLETQLGLPVATTPRASRITEYAAALGGVSDSVFSTSMKIDRWATASELLSRRDELLLSGWGERDSEELPAIVRDLARVAVGRQFMFPSDAERVRRVLEALEEGQQLPPHSCFLLDSPENWPLVWRSVLLRLNTEEHGKPSPQASIGSALHSAQNGVLVGDTNKVDQDSTFRYVRVRSQSAAVDFITGVLAGSPEKLSRTVICCEDDELAMRLDACLRRVGLPTTGASARTRAHPVLQVLPLTLALCWEPVDPQVLVDFLTLPVLPIPRRAANRLAKALVKEPGLGSSEWDMAVEEICGPEQDPDGRLRGRLDTWLQCDRTPRGNEIPSRLVRDRCALVAQWASGRAKSLQEDQVSSPQFIEALQTVAGQASLLGELAEIQGSALTEPQLTHLLDESLAAGIEAVSCIEAEGGPIRVRSLSEIDGSCDWLMWLGLGTTDIPSCRWSMDQFSQLREAGIDIDDGSRSLFSLRSSEARGLSQVQEALLAVSLPQDLEKRIHPLWLSICCLFSEGISKEPLVIEDLIKAGDMKQVSPFVCEWFEAKIEPPRKPQPLWDIPARLLSDRETVSASELQDRLGCPIKWTFNYQAKLRPSPIAKLPEDHQLKGTFCHNVLDRVFSDGGALPTVEEALARVASVFDERLPLDAAPLALPSKYLERERLRGELENATRLLVSTLADGGYRIVGLEVELSGEAFGKNLVGWIDCLAEREDGAEAIIDFKYGGRSKYDSLIREGKAVQLAAYAYGRSKSTGDFPAVAYLILSDGLVFTPSESRIQGNRVRPIAGPSIQTVWKRFSDAIVHAESWLTTDEPVPARPLQEPSDWPDGVTTILDAKLRNGEKQGVCNYCDYKRICGLEETL